LAQVEVSVRILRSALPDSSDLRGEITNRSTMFGVGTAYQEQAGPIQAALDDLLAALVGYHDEFSHDLSGDMADVVATLSRDPDRAQPRIRAAHEIARQVSGVNQLLPAEFAPLTAVATPEEIELIEPLQPFQPPAELSPVPSALELPGLELPFQPPAGLPVIRVIPATPQPHQVPDGVRDELAEIPTITVESPPPSTEATLSDRQESPPSTEATLAARQEEARQQYRLASLQVVRFERAFRPAGQDPALRAWLTELHRQINSARSPREFDDVEAGLAALRELGELLNGCYPDPAQSPPAEDRDRLTRLVREGAARRDPPGGSRSTGAAPAWATCGRCGRGSCRR